MTNAAVCVSYDGPHWMVEYEGRARSYHHTRDAAVYAGRALAAQMQAQLVINGTDGTVGQLTSYGSDRGDVARGATPRVNL